MPEQGQEFQGRICQTARFKIKGLETETSRKRVRTRTQGLLFSPGPKQVLLSCTESSALKDCTRLVNGYGNKVFPSHLPKVLHMLHELNQDRDEIPDKQLGQMLVSIETDQDHQEARQKLQGLHLVSKLKQEVDHVSSGFGGQSEPAQVEPKKKRSSFFQSLFPGPNHNATMSQFTHTVLGHVMAAFTRTHPDAMNRHVPLAKEILKDSTNGNQI